jgi:hypothetical protein
MLKKFSGIDAVFALENRRQNKGDGRGPDPHNFSRRSGFAPPILKTRSRNTTTLIPGSI